MSAPPLKQTVTFKLAHKVGEDYKTVIITQEFEAGKADPAQVLRIFEDTAKTHLHIQEGPPQVPNPPQPADNRKSIEAETDRKAVGAEIDTIIHQHPENFRRYVDGNAFIIEIVREVDKRIWTQISSDVKKLGGSYDYQSRSWRIPGYPQ